MDLSSIGEFKIKKSKFIKGEVLDIYYRTLCNSKNWDLALGYWSLSALKLLAYPLSKFIINNEGKIRLYCNEAISERDYQLMTQSNYNLDQTRLFKDLVKMIEALEGGNNDLFNNCISYLIHNDLLEIKVLIKKENTRGISHQKNSIFSDTHQNTVVLSGSANASEQAFLFNREDTNAFCSFWNEESVTNNINVTIDEFEKTFSEGDEEWKIYEIESEELKEKLNKIGFRKIDKSSLENEAIKHIKKNYRNFSKEIQKEISDELLVLNNEPHFPIFNGKISNPRDYQIKAYNEWINNDFKGIFAMATGTGKTLTSLNVLLEQYKTNGYYNAIILVPTQILVNQWVDECKKFNFKNIFTTYNSNWTSRLKDILLDKRLGVNSNFIFISTYASYNGNKFQQILNNFKCTSTILIADEAHNLGTKRSISNYLHGIKKRIGLSATPNRNFDESGTNEIEKYFNSFSPNHTFCFSMIDAIKNKYLTPYYYYPKFIKLNEPEMEAYAKYSERLLKFFDFEKGTYREEASNLLIQRKRIIHQAANKKLKLLEILNDIKDEDFKHTIVYVPEGFEPDYSENDSSTLDDEDLRIIDDYNSTIKSLGVRTHQVIGGMGISERKKILDQFDKGLIQVLTAMKTLDEGVDIPATKCAIFCASTGNPRQFIQRRGRILRRSKGKDFATVYDLIVEPNDPSFWDYYPKDKKEKLQKMEINIFRNELNRVANFLYACKNLPDLHLKENEDISKLIDLTELYNLDIFELINDLIEADTKFTENENIPKKDI